MRRPANAGGMAVPMETVVGQMTSAFVRRTASFEKVFTHDSGHVTYAKLAWRPNGITPCSGTLRPADTVASGSTRRSPVAASTRSTFLRTGRSPMYTASTATRSRASAFTVAYNVHTLKQKLRALWAAWLGVAGSAGLYVKQEDGHRDMGGAYDAGVPGNVQKAAQALARRGKGKSRRSQAASRSGNSAPGTPATRGSAAMDYLDAEIADSVLAGFTDLASAASSGAGSYALSKDQSEFFLQALTARQQEMAADLTGYVIADLARYNFGRKASVPTLKFSRLDAPSLDELTKALALFPVTRPAPDAFYEGVLQITAGILGVRLDALKMQAVEVEQAGDQGREDAGAGAAS